MTPRNRIIFQVMGSEPSRNKPAIKSEGDSHQPISSPLPARALAAMPDGARERSRPATGLPALLREGGKMNIAAGRGLAA